MGSEILINVRPNQTRVAYVENGELSDLKVERQKAPTSVGSVFKGKVMRVLPGMQAAFVDIGLERAAFLYVGDIRGDIDSEKLLAEDEASENPEKEYEAGSLLESPTTESEAPVLLIQDLLKEGQMILVQVAKDPLGTKGARITTHVSLPGRLLVYMPTLNHLGISRRIVSEQERERLRVSIESLNPRGGVIVRTAGEGADINAMKQDLEYLNRTWKEIQRNNEKRKTPGLIYADLDVELRALRDLLTEEIENVIVDDQRVYKKVVNFVTQFMPKFKNKVKRYRDPQPLFDLYDLDLEISRSLGRTVWLKSGGYIVIDEAEALVVIDVNTGRFVGKKDLEDTLLKTNLEAAKEIAHQLRIRNCGGIIIIDFIDMEKELHREKVMSALKEELSKDRSRTEVVSMSELGLVEMTRKRIRPSLVSTLCESCPYCDGKGYIKQKMTVSSELFREIEREALRSSRELRFVVTCHGDLADWIYAEETVALENLEKKLGCSVAFKIEQSYHIEQFAIEVG
ncbi:MAG: Rne/Rng family ribonuclease [Bdellovibrionaceae bacterium]|nr:Rne/Rng family ribonuclease [Pseudobdellovibrionaceae bacterium]